MKEQWLGGGEIGGEGVNLLKQHKASSKAWGNLILIVGQLGLVFWFIQIPLSIITVTTLLQQRGLMISAICLGLIILGIILVGGVIIFKFGLPSYFGSWNRQFYEHDNPIKKDLEEIKKQIAELKK